MAGRDADVRAYGYRDRGVFVRLGPLGRRTRKMRSFYQVPAGQYSISPYRIASSNDLEVDSISLKLLPAEPRQPSP